MVEKGNGAGAKGLGIWTGTGCGIGSSVRPSEGGGRRGVATATLLLAALTLCGPSLAQTSAQATGQPAGGLWSSSSPFSLSLAAGAAHWSAQCSGAMVCDRNSTSYRVSGSFALTPQAAFEVFYADEGEVKARAWSQTQTALQTTRLRVSGTGLGVAWWFPLDTNWRGVARVGGVYHRVRLEENRESDADPNLPVSDDSRSGFDPTVGLGVSYRLSPQWQLDGRFDWTQTRLRPVASSLIGPGTRGAHHWSLGFTYGF